MIRNTPKAIACWRKNALARLTIRTSRWRGALATADDGPEIARGVIAGTVIDAPGGWFVLRRLEARNYQFLKCFTHGKALCPAFRRRIANS